MLASPQTHDENTATSFMLASPRFASSSSRKKKSYLEDVGRRNSDSKERLERRDLIKRSLHTDHMIGDEDDDDYLTKQLQLASSHFQPAGSAVSRSGSSSSRRDSRRESTSSVNSARSNSDALTKQLQLASSHFQPSGSRVSRSGSSSSRRESTSSVNSARSNNDALNRTIDGILSSPYIENRRKHRTKSTDPIAQSVTTIPKTTTSRRRCSGRDDGANSIDPIAESATTIPKTTTSRRHSSGRGDDAKSSPPITVPIDRPGRRFSLPSSLRSRSKQESQNAARDKEVKVPSPPPFSPGTTAVPETTRRRSGPLLRKTIRTPRRTSSTRSHSLSRSNHSLSRSNHSVEASSSRLSRRVSPHSASYHSAHSRQPDTIGTSMSSLSAHLSQKSYTSDSDDDDDESILSTIFRTVGEVYDECL
jgi:hypothetical protein